MKNNFYIEVIVLIISFLYHATLLHLVNKKNHGVSIVSAMLFAIIVYFNLVPAMIYMTIDHTSDMFIKNILDCSSIQFIYAEINIFVFSSFLALFSLGKSRKHNRDFSVTQTGNRLLRNLAFVTLCVGGVGFLLYINAFGGYRNMLNASGFLRSFRYDNKLILPYRATLLVMPSRLLVAAPALFYTLLRASKTKKVYKISFAVSLVLSVMFLLFNSSKTAIVCFFVSMLIPILCNRLKHPWRILIIAGCVCFPLLGAMDSVFSYFANGYWTKINFNLSEYLEGFAYPYSNVLNLWEITELSGMQWFSSVITGVLEILPKINFLPTYAYTSQFYLGENWKMHHGVPIDIITFGHIQLGIFGVAILASCLGILCRRIDQKQKRLDCYIYYPVFASVIVNSFSFVASADPGNLVKSGSALLLGLACVLWTKVPAEQNNEKLIENNYGEILDETSIGN